MVTEVPVTADTRRSLVKVVLESIAVDVEARTEQVPAGPWDGVPVITAKAWGEALEAALARPIPPASENTAELATPAVIYFQAVCPRCGGRSAIKLEVGTELKIDWHSATLALKGKTKAVTHICGQTTVDEAISKAEDGEQQDFELGDIVGPVEHWHDHADGFGDRLSHDHPDGQAPHDHAADGWGLAGWSIGRDADNQAEVVTPEEAEAGAVDEAAALLLADAPLTEPERCPYPGCVRDAEHKGRHKVVKPAEGEPADG